MSHFTPRSDAEPVLLPGDHPVTVTKEERHQAVLARHLSTDGRARQVAAELGFCRIAEGKYRGGRAVEVHIGAERVGELTVRMSERYAPLVEAVLAGGGRPVCEAVVTGGSRGAQVELRLPAPDTMPTALPPPPRASSSAWASAPPPGGPNERSLPTPPTTVTPMARPTGEGPGAVRDSADGPRVTRGSGRRRHGQRGVTAHHIDPRAATGSHRGPVGDPAVRLPAQPKNRTRKAVLWGVGVFLGLGFLGSLGDDEPAGPRAGTTAGASSATATTSGQPTTTTTPTTTPVPTSTDGTDAGAGAGAGVNAPDRQRTTTRSIPATTTTVPTRTREQPASVYYKNCDAVRAAGAAPIRRGDPGYAGHLDRDGDGVGCAGD